MSAGTRRRGRVDGWWQRDGGCAVRGEGRLYGWTGSGGLFVLVAQGAMARE